VLLAFTGAGLVFFVALGVVWIPSMARLYADFGGALPWLTRAIMTRAWLGGGALLIVSGALGGALAPSRRLRVGILIAALAITVLALAATLFGAYSPLFQLSAAVRAE
jgi:energy-converting hydrogenase Eha subunit E